MWVRPESGRSAHAWQPGDYEPPLSGEPSKKIPNARGNGGRNGPGGRRKYSRARKGLGDCEGTKGEDSGGELYTRDLSHRRRLFSSSFSLCPYLRGSSSFSLQLLLFPFNQPPVVFHLAGAPLEPTNHHRIPYSEARPWPPVLRKK